MAALSFIGGPHDGAILNTGLGAPFLWTDGKKCFRAPARGRVLYQFYAPSTCMFVGNKTGLCGCGVFRSRDLPCRMCGAVEVVA